MTKVGKRFDKKWPLEAFERSIFEGVGVQRRTVSFLSHE